MLVELTATSVREIDWLAPHCVSIEQLPIAVVVFTPDGTPLCMNQRAAALWRLGEDESIAGDAGQANLLRFGQVEPLSEALRKNEPTYNLLLAVVRADNSAAQVVANIAPINHTDNGLQGAIVTLHSLHEDAAVASDERQPLPEVVDGFPAFVAELQGPEHIVARVNQYCDEMMGGSDLLGKAAVEAWPQLRDQGYLDWLDDVYHKGEAYSQDDSSVWLRMQPGAPIAQMRCHFRCVALYGRDGAITGTRLTLVDLGGKGVEAATHAALATEKRLRLYETILANTPDLVYVFDLNHRFTYANAALLTLWGVDAEYAIGKSFLELGYEPWHAAMHGREIDRVIRTKDEVRGEVPYTGTLGTRMYEYIFVPVLGTNGEVEAIAGTTRDTTGRKQLERELQKRAEQLFESDRKKDEFIAMLAHELRNPLAPIRNGLQVIEMAAGDHAVVDQARVMMQRQLKHMVRLVDDLMDVSRITRNKLNLQKDTIAIDEVVDSAIETAKPALEMAGHTLSVTLPAQTYYLYADLTRLAQVFSNLLSNSIKYTEPGGHITLRADVRERELQVEISDNGIGIPPQKLSSIFDLFSQVSSNSKHGDGGLGIGLALVKALVSMHGGTVEATSRWPERGTQFTVTLPYLDRAIAPPDRAATDKCGETKHLIHRILVVDDNRDACLSMVQLFELLGHKVRSAYNGLDALAIAEEFLPEVVFMDIGMPQLNGFEATRQIRARTWGKTMRIVAITGWGQEGDRQDSKSAGFDGHLVKPVDLQAVQEQLKYVGSD